MCYALATHWPWLWCMNRRQARTCNCQCCLTCGIHMLPLKVMGITGCHLVFFLKLHLHVVATTPTLKNKKRSIGLSSVHQAIDWAILTETDGIVSLQEWKSCTSEGSDHLPSVPAQTPGPLVQAPGCWNHSRVVSPQRIYNHGWCCIPH